MRVIKDYCDHCGKEVDAMHDYVETEVGIVEFMDVDLCVNCINELQGIVKSFCKKE